MNIEILEQKNNLLLKREEIKILVFDEKTPSFSEASKIVGEKFNKPEENINIQKIKGKFGERTFLILAFIYEDLELRKKFGAKKKTKLKQEKKPEVKPVEEKQEEVKSKQVEEKKEVKEPKQKQEEKNSEENKKE